MLHNKRGDEVMSVWNILIWVIILIVIVSSVFIFRSSKMDVREIEAEILSQRIERCVNNPSFDISMLNDEENSLEFCGLNSEMIIKSGYFYIGMNFEGINNIEVGNKDIVTQCALKEEARARAFGSCADDSVLMKLKKDGVEMNVLLKLNVGVNNQNEKI